MIEIRIHGRGGQGAVIASKILAVAAFRESKWVQSFPKFGVERRGAPVEAFLRISDQKILIRSEVTEPDYIIVQDPSLTEVVDVTAGLKQNGSILVNTHLHPDAVSIAKDFTVACVNASKIAAEHGLGSKNAPIVNTAICGAFAKSSGLIKKESVFMAIEAEIPIKPEKNIEAAEAAYNATLFSKER